MLKLISELVPGDLVDLDGDKYADPKNDNPWMDCEYATVVEIERETPNCTCVYFDGIAVGFPPEHVVTVAY